MSTEAQDPSEEGQNPEQQQQQGNDKITKKYDAAFKKLVALMGGEKNLKKSSIPTSEVGDIVTELLKERRQKTIDKFKVDAMAILDKKIEFDKEVRKAEDQLKNTVIAKKKEFTEEMIKVFATLENIQEVEKAYAENLKGTSDPSSV